MTCNRSDLNPTIADQVIALPRGMLLRGPDADIYVPHDISRGIRQTLAFGTDPLPRPIGVHYTPAPLAERLAMDGAEEWRTRFGGHPDRILDPACGGGALLSAAHAAFPSARLIGVDVDPSGVEQCRLAMPGAQVLLADALTAPTPRADWVIMNPPFLGGGKISSLLGASYAKAISRRWGGKGLGDIAAYFLHVAVASGARAISIIATNTLAQGDTREIGLARLVTSGWSITRADTDIVWPGDAAVTVSVVHLACGNPSAATLRQLNGVPVRHINSRLGTTPTRPDPVKLASNAGCSYQGTIVLGLGFTLTPEERAALIEQNPKNAQRIFPYLGGEEVNTSPNQSHHRYVISFGQLDLQEAEQWPDLLEIVREKVKHEREKQKDIGGKKFWWQHLRPRPELYAALEPLKRCLVTAIVSKHLILSFQPTNRIFAHKLYVFPFDANTHFAILQSRVHESWARLLSSTLKTDLNYSASRCFETFPFPDPDPRTIFPALEAAGAALGEARAAFMRETAQGLTKTYNALKDPACAEPRILRLRRLHERLDRAVLDAYGWGALEVPAYCPQTDAERAQLRAFGDELLERLFALNAERAAQERRP